VFASSNKIEATAYDETHHFVMVYICDGSFLYALSVAYRGHMYKVPEVCGTLVEAKFFFHF